MADLTPDGKRDSIGSKDNTPDDGKKELSKEKYRTYLLKARKRIKKLEEENEALQQFANQAPQPNNTVGEGVSARENALEEEVHMWKINYQGQVQIVATLEERVKEESEKLAEAVHEAKSAQARAAEMVERCSEVDRLEARNRDLEEELISVSARSEHNRAAEAERHSQLLAEMQQQLESLKAAASDDVQAQDKLAAEQAQSKIAALQDEVDSLLRNAGKAEYGAARAQQERDAMQETLSQLESQIGASKDVESRLRESHEMAVKDRDEALARISDLQEEASRFEGRLAKAASDAEQAVADARDDEHRKAVAAATTEAGSETERLRQDRDELEKELNRTRDALVTSEEESGVMLAKLKDESESVGRRAADAEADNGRLKEALSELQLSSDQSTSDLERVMRDLEKVQLEREEALGLKKQAEDNAAAVHAAASAESHKDMSMDLERLRVEVSSLHTRFDAETKELSLTQAAKQTLESQVSHLEARVKELEVELEKESAALKDSEGMQQRNQIDVRKHGQPELTVEEPADGRATSGSTDGATTEATTPEEELTVCEGKGEEVEALQQRIEEVEALLEERTREVDWAKEHAARQEEKSRHDVEELEGILANVRQNEETLKTRMSALTDEFDGMKAALVCKEEALATEERRSGSIQERAELAEAIVKELQGKREASLAESEENTARVSRDQEHLQARLSDLEEKLNNAQQAAQSAKEELSAAREAFRELEARAKETESQLRDLQVKCDASTEDRNKMIESLRIDKMALEQHVQAMEEKVVDGAAKAEAELEEHVAASKEKMNKAVTRMRSLKAKGDAASAELATTLQALEASRQNCSDVEARCTSLEKTVEEQRAEMHREDTRVAEDELQAKRDSKAQLQDLQERLQAARDREQEVAEQLAAVQSKHEDAIAALEERSSDLAGMSVALEESKRESEIRSREAEDTRDSLHAVNARVAELERELHRVMQEGKDKEAEAEGAARDGEEVLEVLQGQVDTANQERDEALSKAKQASQEYEAISQRLQETTATIQSLQTDLTAAREEESTLKMEAERVKGLEETVQQLISKGESQEAECRALTSRLEEEQERHTELVATKDKALSEATLNKEEMESKVKRLKSLLAKLQKSNQSKDADISALRAPVPPPKAFVVSIRVRSVDAEGGNPCVWCLIRPLRSPEGEGATVDIGEGGEDHDNRGGVFQEENQATWHLEDKVREWMQEGISVSDENAWPRVLQDSMQERLAEAERRLEEAREEVKSANEQTKEAVAEFGKYKARAHTTLKKMTSSGAEDKRKDELIASLEAARNQAEAEGRERAAELEAQASQAVEALQRKEEELNVANEQLEAAQAAVHQARELQNALQDNGRRLASLQEAEDEHTEEVSSLRAAMDEMRNQLRDAKGQVSESASIIQRLKEELEEVARERQEPQDTWASRGDGGWAGQRMLFRGKTEQSNGGGDSSFRMHDDRPRSSEERLVEKSDERSDFEKEQPSYGRVSAEADDNGAADSASPGIIDKNDGRLTAPLLAVAEQQRRNISIEAQVHLEISEMRTELAEALLRVEQLSAQEAVLKATVRTLEAELKTERDLGTSETAPINVAYLKSAVVRYMSTRDTGEQRSLLRVVATILQLTKKEIEAIETRIAELEKTMVGRAGSMVGGAGRRVGGVVGGVVGLVWRGGGRGGEARTSEGATGDDSHGFVESSDDRDMSYEHSVQELNLTS